MYGEDLEKKRASFPDFMGKTILWFVINFLHVQITGSPTSDDLKLFNSAEMKVWMVLRMLKVC